MFERLLAPFGLLNEIVRDWKIVFWLKQSSFSLPPAVKIDMKKQYFK